MKTALKLALVSKLAYEEVPGKIRDALCMPRLRHLSSDGAQGFVAGNDKNILVALRGTDEIQDWIANLNLQQSNAYGGKVHTGFALQMMGIWPALFDAVITGYTNQKIWVTGHSLGGVLAVLAAYQLKKHGFNSQVYTYGAPRVFDPVAAAVYDVPIKRFVNNTDIVPHLPASTPWASYSHVGELTYFRRDGSLGPYNLLYQIGKAMLRGSAATTVGMLKDHSIDEYIRKIHLNLE
jgi:predicted lipase